MVAAVRAMNDIKNLKLIALGTAMQLFRPKVEPTLTYGLELIWEYLTCEQLLELEEMKARYMKSARGVSTHPVEFGIRAGERNVLRRGPKNLSNAVNDDGLQRCTSRTER
jgi:hypothetical protein